MEQGMLPLLRAWESFYVIIGPSAAVLIGLQFVVIVMMAELNALSNDSSVNAWGTPTIVHFCIVLLVSAILSAPWPALAEVALALGACGVGGLVYMVLVVLRARQPSDYQPVLEDWIWHCGLPLLSYAALLVAAIMLQGAPVRSMFVVGATMVLLLFIGIHNAWDTVVYVGIQQRQRQREEQS